MLLVNCLSTVHRFRRVGPGNLQLDLAPVFDSYVPGVRGNLLCRDQRTRRQNAGGAKSIAGLEVFWFDLLSPMDQEERSSLKRQTQLSPVRGGHGYVRTQPPEPLLKALLQRDCTANVPVERLMSAEAPWPEEIQAHLSPFSARPESSQPPL